MEPRVLNRKNHIPAEGWLERLGLHRPELRAWAMYDWANSAMVTIVIATFYPLFFEELVQMAEPGLPPQEAKDLALARHGAASWIAIVVAGILAPILGAVADFTASKKRFIGLFMGIGVAAVACMYLIQHGQWLFAAVLFIIANIGATGSFVFYDSLLPHVAREEEMDRVSSAGFALGYIGGGLLLAASLLLVLKPAWFGVPPGDGTLPVRITFLAVAVWWFLFSIPLFLRVSEPPRKLEPDENPDLNPFKVAFTRLSETFKGIRQFRYAFLMLLAFLLYSDGINAIIRMAGIYAGNMNIDRGVIVTAILLTQLVGIPFTFLFGMLAGKIGAKRAIYLGLSVYMIIPILAFFMSTAAHFIALALLVGMVQGGTQALSRSLFASMIPRYKSGEFFGFFGVVDKFAGVIGVSLLLAVNAATKSPRLGVLSIVLLFVTGFILLKKIDVAKGRAIARNAEQAASSQLRPV